MECLFLVFLGSLLVPLRAQSRANCKPMTSTFCQGLGYSTTQHPTGATGYNLREIGQIVETSCSPNVAVLMCRVVVPECGSVEDARMRPCRALCEKVKTDCEAPLKAKRISWPSKLRCDTLSENNCAQGQVSSPTQTSPATCEEISVALCRDQTYSETVLPNLLGHASQEEAGLEINKYSPLIQVGCSSHLKPFLCSVFIPKCVSGARRPPCRMLCEKARSGCESLMNKYDIQWPEDLRCEAFTTESCENYGVGSSGGVCEPITIPMCRNLSYNQTISPNLLGHTSQREAVGKMSFFNAMAQSMCPVDVACSAKRGSRGRWPALGFSLAQTTAVQRFPRAMCVSEDSRPDTLDAEGILAKLNAGGYTVHSPSPVDPHGRRPVWRPECGRGLQDGALCGSCQAGICGELREQEPALRPSKPMKRALSDHEFDLDDETFIVLWNGIRSRDGIEYDEYVAVMTKLLILRDRSITHQLRLPCDCQVASFSYKQFMNSAII
ncbi:hypothetical protein KUCAC02_016648 [Chaenocephalus aceratus]|nr:hypothetical protein KUCAC02_016648 [Chaenocephalus aceratus]